MKKEVTLHTIDKDSTARILGYIYAAFGVLGGLILIISALAEGSFGGIIILLALLAPLFCGLMGWVAGLITALVYNYAAGRVGGIKGTIEIAE